MVASCAGPDSVANALNSKNADCLSIGYLGSVFCLRERDISYNIRFSSCSWINSSYVSGNSSNSCIRAISSSLSLEISILDTGLPSRGARPRPKPPRSRISPAPSPVIF